MGKSNIKLLLRPAMLMLPFVLGIIFQLASNVSWKTASGTSLSLLLIRAGLMMMFYFVLLKIDFRKLVPVKEHIPVVMANAFMGVVPFLLLRALGYPDLALAAFFVGITPTANAAPVVMDFLEGKVEFVLTGFVLTNFFIDVALIFLLPWATGNFNAQFIAGVIKQLAVIVLVPFILAIVTRWGCAKLKRQVPKVPGMVTFSIWCASLFVISAQSTMFFQQHREITLSKVMVIALLSFAICAINFTCGKLVGGKTFSREASQTLGQKNTTLTIFLALSFGTPVSALGPTFYVLWHNVWNAFQMYRHDSMKQKQ
ncbi:MAG: hypothetical protein IJC21_03400 [Lentisphaeria bacterium]|nr:hypothetical protein [Lentisphaeria bacterium]